MSWNTVTLGDVISLQNGYAFKSSEYSDEGYFLMRITNVQQGFIQNNNPKFVSIPVNSKLKQFILNEGDILISLTGDVGRVGILKEENLPAALNQRVARVTIKSSLDLDKRYLFNLLNSEEVRRKIESQGHGAAQLNVSTKDILSIDIPLPPIATQQKIVAKLDAIFAEIDKATAAAEANAKNSEALFQSYLTQFFERGGENWSTKSVEDLVTEKIITKPFDGNHGEIHPVAADYTLSGIPFLMASDLKDGLVDLVNCKFLPKSIADNLRVGFAKNNDILITHKGTIGRVAKLRTHLDYVMLSPQVTSYRVVRDDFLSRDFLLSYFQSSFFQTQLYEMAKGGSTRAYAGITKQGSLLIKLPPLDEQNKLSNFFHQLETEKSKLIFTYISKVKNLILLKNSILKQAFNGELIKE